MNKVKANSFGAQTAPRHFVGAGNHKTAAEIFCGCELEDYPGMQALGQGVSLQDIDFMDEAYGALGGLATVVGGTLLERLFTTDTATDTRKANVRGIGQTIIGLGARLFFPESAVVQRAGQAMTDIGLYGLINNAVGDQVADLIPAFSPIINLDGTDTAVQANVVTDTATATSACSTGSCTEYSVL